MCKNKLNNKHYHRIDNIFEKNAYLIAFRLTLFLSISTFLLSIYLFFVNIGFINFLLTFIGFLLSSSAFLLLYFTGKHRSVMLFFNIIFCLVVSYSLYSVSNRPRVVEGLWMMTNSFLAFATLGRKWGTIITVSNALVLASFFLLFYNDQIKLLHEVEFKNIISYVINILICFTFLFYVNWQSIITNNKAQKNLDNNRTFLENQFDLINKQNEEKTILLKEIHHRVKNNLQVIVSLLRLQSQEIADKKSKDVFKEAVSRVITMSLIHEKIYKSETLSSVDINDYFKSLADHLILNYPTQNKVDFKFITKIKQMDLKPIVPLALIFNELVSNSIKYAFVETKIPLIKLELVQLTDKDYELFYSDNGKWRDEIAENSFGLKLIDTLCEQLNGTYQLEKKNDGTFYSFYFEDFNS
ncbi:MAG: sensor histidine kinase [Flavobacteriia bacterium]|nr:sensor histidine kinase [Flavobacteriia bacterium]